MLPTHSVLLSEIENSSLISERKKQESNPARTSGARAETEEGPVEFDGLSLLEVYNIVYMGDDEIEPENQVGLISMGLDIGSQTLYSEDMAVKSYPSLKFGDTIFPTGRFIGPVGPMCSSLELEMCFGLFRGAYKGSFKVAAKYFEDTAYCAERKIRSVDGTGHICVVLGALFNATVANLKINISGATDVHGIVAARNSQLDQPSCTCVLFWKKPAEKIEVGCNGEIPLSRSCVGVPLDSVFYVDIALYIDDGEIYTKTASFVPQMEGEKIEVISIPSKNTNIGVKVKWKTRSAYHSVYSESEDEYDSEEDAEG
ncbi:uncharacterized protein LOC141666042 [Apium graveolens]|uniref:uncharacterized protein LOC141666042 n=1 Tax=Apium graveolens TaxID=4045 RepID=UPI003D7A006E